MAISKIMHPRIKGAITSSAMKLLADSNVITCTDDSVCLIRIVNDIAFVRLEKVKIVHGTTPFTVAFRGIPMPYQKADGVGMTYNSSGEMKKRVHWIVYADSDVMYIITSGYSDGETLESVTFSYPLA